MNEVASPFASICLTHLVRWLAAYAILRLLCRLTRDSNLRFQLCAVFMGMMVMGWLGLLVHAGTPPSVVSQSASSPTAGFLWPWTLHLTIPARIATVLSRAGSVYITLFAFLLFRFSMRFRRLRSLVRASLPPPKTLQEWFESVRSCTVALPCELRLVSDLRSPATAGWRCPKVFLPYGLLSRLDTEQLRCVLRHELMHVRRRDYLLDNLATLSCYLLFFHPAAWLARRSMRWERELICDGGAIQDSGIHRLDYAACLTTVAGWRLAAEQEKSIHFLSPTSLLAARVHALTSPRPGAYYAHPKKAVVGFAAGAILAAAAWITPDLAVSCARPAAIDSAIQESSIPIASAFDQKEPRLKTEPRNIQRRRKMAVVDIIAPDQYARLIPVRSIASTVASPSRSASATLAMPQEKQSHEGSARPPVRRGFMGKVGAWTVHRVKLGIVKLGAIRRQR